MQSNKRTQPIGFALFEYLLNGRKKEKGKKNKRSLGKKSAAKKLSVRKGKRHRRRVKRGGKKPVYPLNRFLNRKKNGKKKGSSSSKKGKRKQK